MFIFIKKKSYRRKIILGFFCLYLTLISTTVLANPQLYKSLRNSDQLAPLVNFYINERIPKFSQPALTFINEKDLPNPYSFLLTQPLMTLGIAQYYRRTPKIRDPLYFFIDANKNTYSRAIIMIVDHNKCRDDSLVADKQGESVVVELGLITVNFKSLPPAVIYGVLHSQTPFGALLAMNHIKIHNVDRNYFRLKCNKIFSKFLQCHLGEALYGRTNTLVRDSNSQWIAHVVEILPKPPIVDR